MVGGRSRGVLLLALLGAIALAIVLAWGSQPDGPVELRASIGPGAQLRARFDRRGAELEWYASRGRLETRAVRCAERELLLEPGSWRFAREPDLASRRLGPAVSEWVRLHRQGFEHGFDVDAPGCRTQLVVELATPELQPRLDGRRVWLRPAGAASSLGYEKLAAVDSAGKRLPALMSVRSGIVRLEVEVADALWPVQVDPVLFVEESRALPSPAGDGESGAEFGFSVALSGDTAVVGVRVTYEPGYVYVFVRSGAKWVRQQKLLRMDSAVSNGFGLSLALAGDDLLVCAPSGNQPAALYWFARDGGTWSQPQKITVSDGGPADGFCAAVALSGGVAVVGAPAAEVGGEPRGAAHVFVRTAAGWSQKQVLIAGDGRLGAGFGTSVSVSDTMILLGAPYHPNPGPRRGRAYAFVLDGGVWHQQRTFEAPADGGGADHFGWAVALSGEDAIVLADDQTNGGVAEVLVFSRVGGDWQEQQRLPPATWMSFGPGSSLAASSGLLVVGSPLTDQAHVFARSGLGWAFQESLMTPDPLGRTYFGLVLAAHGERVLATAPFVAPQVWPVDPMVGGGAWVFRQTAGALVLEDELQQAEVTDVRLGSSASVSGDWAFVGAPGDDPGSNPGPGSVYVFSNDAGAWTFRQKLVPNGQLTNCAFGARVVVLGNTAVVGAPECSLAYAFLFSGAEWRESQRLAPDDGGYGGRFGASLALSTDVLMVGAPEGGSSNGSSDGAVFVFGLDRGQWVETQRLVPPTSRLSHFGRALASQGGTALISGYSIYGEAVTVFTRSQRGWEASGDLAPPTQAGFIGFGWSLALGSETAFVGAPDSDQGQGAVFAYRSDGGAWSGPQKLLSPKGPFGRFGASIAVSHEYALIGAPREQPPSASLFVMRGDTWTFERTVQASDGESLTEFGAALAIDGTRAVIGAPGTFSPAPYLSRDEGAVYFERLEKTTGEACQHAEQCSTRFCIDGVCCESSCGGGDPTDCQACSTATGASLDGTCRVLGSAATCRPSSGSCDVAESCNGFDPSCPADGLAVPGVACPGGTCRAGQCLAPPPPGGCGCGGAGSARGGLVPALLLALAAALEKGRRAGLRGRSRPVP